MFAYLRWLVTGWGPWVRSKAARSVAAASTSNGAGALVDVMVGLPEGNVKNVMCCRNSSPVEPNRLLLVDKFEFGTGPDLVNVCSLADFSREWVCMVLWRNS